MGRWINEYKEDAELPWRRYPHWLVLRVAVQRWLCFFLGPLRSGAGRAHCKFLICIRPCSVARRVCGAPWPGIVRFPDSEVMSLSDPNGGREGQGPSLPPARLGAKCSQQFERSFSRRFKALPSRSTHRGTLSRSPFKADFVSSRPGRQQRFASSPSQQRAGFPKHPRAAFVPKQGNQLFGFISGSSNVRCCQGNNQISRSLRRPLFLARRPGSEDRIYPQNITLLGDRVRVAA